MVDDIWTGLGNTKDFMVASGSSAFEGAKGLVGGGYDPATMGADFSKGFTAAEKTARANLAAANAASPSLLKKEALQKADVQLTNAEANYAARGEILSFSDKAAIARGDAASMGISEVDLNPPVVSLAETAGTTAQGTADSLLTDSKVAVEGGGAFNIKKGFEDAAKVTVSQNIMAAMNQQDDPRPMGSYVPQSNFLDMQNQIFSVAGVNQPLPAETPSSAPRRTVDFNNINFDFYELEQQNNTSPNYAMA